MTRASPTSETVTLHVPFKLVRRGGRKEVQSPAGAPPQHKTDTTLVKAMARAFRWQRLLDSGAYATVADLALAERINPSYVSRVLRLTLLAPHIVEAVLERRQAEDVTLPDLMKPLPVQWEEQSCSIMRASPDRR